MKTVGSQLLGKQGIQRKAASQDGASFSLALMLFLVCALLSSVVVSAGMTAVGHNSQLVDREQRYYSVTSAVELLKSQFEGQTAKVTCTREAAGPADGADPDGASQDEITIRVGDVELRKSLPSALTGAVKGDLSLPELSALYLLNGSQGSTVDFNGAWNRSEFTSLEAFSSSFTVDSPAAGVDGLSAGALSVDVEGRFREDGSLCFYVHTRGEAADVYGLTLVMDADVDVDEATSTSQPVSASPGTAGEVVTTTRTLTLRWKPGALLIGRSI